MVQTEFLQEFLPTQKKINTTIFLESAGIHCSQLQSILEWVDIVSMDIKIPSTTGEKPNYEANRNFLEIASAKELFVKVVVGENSSLEEMDTVLELLRDYSVPLILQPLEKVDAKDQSPSPATLMKLMNYCGSQGKKIRVIPQTHKIMDLL